MAMARDGAARQLGREAPGLHPAPHSTILMRNFPRSWVATATVADLPTKVQHILLRFGPLLQLPEVCAATGGPVTVRATFADPAMALLAVQTLHGIDMRSDAEKAEVGNAQPAESERFWARMVDAHAAAAPTEAARGAGSAAVAGEEAAAEDSAKQKQAMPAPDTVEEDDTEESDYDPFGADADAAAAATPEEDQRPAADPRAAAAEEAPRPAAPAAEQRAATQSSVDYATFDAANAGAGTGAAGCGSAGGGRASAGQEGPKETEDTEDEGAFDALIELLRNAEQAACRGPPAQQPCQAKTKPAAEYEYNPSTQRWEPKAAAPAGHKAAAAAAPDPPESVRQSPPAPAPCVAGASGPPEVWATGWKLRLCRNFPLGLCTYGSRCRFAHGEQDLGGGRWNAAAGVAGATVGNGVSMAWNAAAGMADAPVGNGAWAPWRTAGRGAGGTAWSGWGAAAHAATQGTGHSRPWVSWGGAGWGGHSGAAAGNGMSTGSRSRSPPPARRGQVHHQQVFDMVVEEPVEVKPPRSYAIAECEGEARADEERGVCLYTQALAVRLSLRFESKPSDILSIMADAGLPAAKDQRSTVKAIMRLCHPDKCKHPDAKRAMQILSPLLT